MSDNSEKPENAKSAVTRRNTIKARCHSVGHTVSGRTRYPFAAMVVNDFFVLMSQERAVKARNAIATFKAKNPGKQFTVYQFKPGIWVCRRIS